jgi:hypothetical protein
MNRFSQILGALVVACGVLELLRIATGLTLLPDPPGAPPMQPWAAISLSAFGSALVALARWGDRARVRDGVSNLAALVLLATAVSLTARAVALGPSELGFERTRLLGIITLSLGTTSLLLSAIGRWRWAANGLAGLIMLIAIANLLGVALVGVFPVGDSAPANTAATLAGLFAGASLLAKNGLRSGRSRES